MPHHHCRPGDDSAEFFEARVRPVLANNCYAWSHTGSQLGGLRADSLDGLLKGGNSGPAIVPGKPETASYSRRTPDRHPAPRCQWAAGSKIRRSQI